MHNGAVSSTPYSKVHIAPETRTKESLVSPETETAILDSFKAFAAGEKQKILEKQKENARQKAVKLAELKRFSENFKLSTPIPEDLEFILPKYQQKEPAHMTVQNSSTKRNAKHDLPASSQQTSQHFEKYDALGEDALFPRRIIPGAPTRSLWLGNVSSTTKELDLIRLLGYYGDIESVRILAHKNCAFVNFRYLESAIMAKSQFNGRQIGVGSGSVRIEYAKSHRVKGSPPRIETLKTDQDIQMPASTQSLDFKPPYTPSLEAHISTNDALKSLPERETTDSRQLIAKKVLKSHSEEANPQFTSAELFSTPHLAFYDQRGNNSTLDDPIYRQHLHENLYRQYQQLEAQSQYLRAQLAYQQRLSQAKAAVFVSDTLNQQPLDLTGTSSASFQDTKNVHKDHQDDRIPGAYAESSIGQRSSALKFDNHLLGSSTGRTNSTRPTTVTESWSPKPLQVQPPMITSESVLESRPGKSLSVLKGQTVPEEFMADGDSIVSKDSIILVDPVERDLIIRKFSSALLKDLPTKCLQPHSKPLESLAFRKVFSESLRDFSIEIINGTARRSRTRQASKAVLWFRNQILIAVQQALGGFDRPEQDKRISPSIVRRIKDSGLEEQTWTEKCNDWTIDGEGEGADLVISMPEDLETHVIDDLPVEEALSIGVSEISMSTYDSEDADHSLDTTGRTAVSSQKDQDLFNYLVEHSAFAILTQNLRKRVEQYFGDQMELIRHRVLLSLRRPGKFDSASEDYVASFHLDWNPSEFLEEQYPEGRRQPLRHVLTLTGGPENAQLTTAEQYLSANWSSDTFVLIDHLTFVISQGEMGKSCMSNP